MADYGMLFGGPQLKSPDIYGSYIKGQKDDQTLRSNELTIAGQQLKNKDAQNSLDMSAFQRLSHTAKGLAAIQDDAARNRAYQAVLPHLQKLAPDHQWPQAISQQDAAEFATQMDLLDTGGMTESQLRALQLQISQGNLDAKNKQLDLSGRRMDRQLDIAQQNADAATKRANASAGQNSGLYGNVIWRQDASGNITPVQLSKGQSIPDLGTGERWVASPTTMMQPEIQDKLTPIKAEQAKETAKSKKVGEQQGETIIQGTINAPTAIKLFGDMEAAIKQQPDAAIGRGYQTVAGVFGAGDQTKQDAMSVADTAGSQLMAYANKLPGPASDADRIDFKASVGVIASTTATKSQKLAALNQAREAFKRLQQKYGGSAQPEQNSGSNTDLFPQGQVKFLGFE